MGCVFIPVCRWEDWGFKNLFIFFRTHLLIYCGLRWIFVALLWLPPVVGSGGYSSWQITECARAQ